MVAQRLTPYLNLPAKTLLNHCFRKLSELLEMPPYLFPCDYKPQSERRELVSSFLKKKQ